MVCRFTGLLLGALALSSSAGPQQPNPSLPQTASWLHNIYASHGTFQFNNGAKQTVSLAFNGCSVRITAETTGNGAPSIPDRTEEADLDLGKLDPNHGIPHTNYEKTTASVILRTSDGAQSIKTVTSSPSAPPHADMRSEYSLLLPLGDYTARAEKAWVHAIQLCGGKPSAF